MTELNTPRKIIQAILNGETVEMYIEEGNQWAELVSINPLFIRNFDTILHGEQYRIKPRTIMIGNMEVPEPVRDASEMKNGEGYYLPDLHRARLYDVSSWDGDDLDLQLLKHGLVHKTKEAALLHAKALIKISGGSYE